MKAEVGTMVVDSTGFGYLVKIVTDRTANTIATRHLNGSTSDRRASLDGFRVYDKAKVDRLLQLEAELREKREEQRELYLSLERIQ